MWLAARLERARCRTVTLTSARLTSSLDVKNTGLSSGYAICTGTLIKNWHFYNPQASDRSDKQRASPP